MWARVWACGECLGAACTGPCAWCTPSTHSAAPGVDGGGARGLRRRVDGLQGPHEAQQLLLQLGIVRLLCAVQSAVEPANVCPGEAAAAQRRAASAHPLSSATRTLSLW